MLQARYLKMMSVLTIAVLTGISPATRVAAQAVDHEDEGRTLVGTWIVQVTLRNCQTHMPLGAPFLSLLTYESGGTTTDTTSNPQFGPNQRGPGHGVWIHTGNHAYKALSVAFVTKSMDGSLVSTFFLNQRIDVKTPDEYDVTAYSQFIGPDGKKVLSSGCSTAVGKRLELEK